MRRMQSIPLLVGLLIYLGCCNQALYAQGEKLAEIDFENFDNEYLATHIFTLLNQQREKSRRQAFNYSYRLQGLAESIVKEERGTYFRQSCKKHKRILKKLKLKAKNSEYQGRYLDCSMDFLPLLQLKEGEKYYFKEENDQNFFKYKKKKKEAEPIEKYTYEALAEEILRRTSRLVGRTFRSTKNHVDFGCFIQAEQKASNRIPRIKVLCIIGGYRLGRLKSE